VNDQLNTMYGASSVHPSTCVLTREIDSGELQIYCMRHVQHPRRS